VIGGIANNEDLMAFGGLLLTVQLFAGIVVLVLATPLRPRRIEDHQGIFKGAGEAFLRLVEIQG
jgi:hypothetical protein